MFIEGRGGLYALIFFPLRPDMGKKRSRAKQLTRQLMDLSSVYRT